MNFFNIGIGIIGLTMLGTFAAIMWCGVVYCIIKLIKYINDNRRIKIQRADMTKKE